MHLLNLSHKVGGSLISVLSSMCGGCWEKAGFNYLETRTSIRIPLENTFGVIRLHSGSNSDPNVGHLVDVLKNVSSGAILLEVWVTQTVRMIRLSFWTIYNHSLRNLTLFYHNHPQIKVLEQMVLFLFMLQSKCSRMQWSSVTRNSVSSVCHCHRWRVASPVMTVRHVSHPQLCWWPMLSCISKSMRRTKSF